MNHAQRQARIRNGQHPDPTSDERAANRVPLDAPASSAPKRAAAGQGSKSKKRTTRKKVTR